MMTKFAHLSIGQMAWENEWLPWENDWLPLAEKITFSAKIFSTIFQISREKLVSIWVAKSYDCSNMVLIFGRNVRGRKMYKLCALAVIRNYINKKVSKK